MRLQVGVGLAAGILLCLAALSASATGNAWGTHLAEMKSTATARSSVGNGNGNAWGLMLADIKGKKLEDIDEHEHGDVDEHEHADVDEHEHGDVDEHEHADIDEHEGGRGEHPQAGPPGVTPPVGGPPVVVPPHTPSEVAAVPEPSAALLFGAGTGLVVIALRRPRR